MGLIHYHFAESETTQSLALLDGALSDALMRLFGVQNAQRSGIYESRIVVFGVSGTLVKCEFGDVHTFLLFRPDDALFDDVVIDVTYRQFLLLMEHLSESDVVRAKQLDLLSGYRETFVGSGRELLALFDADAAAQRMRALDRLRDDFFSVMESIKIMFDKNVQHNICGRPMQQQQQQQQQQHTHL